jgi:hypothetical protein
MRLFSLGETIIDTKRNSVVSVVAVIPQGENSITDLYVLRENEDTYYIADSEDLIVYDKYYFDTWRN